MSTEYSTLIENVRVVRPGHDSVVTRDIATANGRFAAVEPDIPRSNAEEVFDADGLLGFPGAVDAAVRCQEAYPDVEFGLETTAGHLLLDYERAEVPWSKVNPPIRSPADREYLWDRVEDGTLEWVITDHANCPREMRPDPDDPDDVWGAKAGFAGSEFLLPGIFSQATSRGLSPNRVAGLVAGKPAERFGLYRKGDIAPAYDADLALLDPDETWTVRAEHSLSDQGYTPFEGMEVTGRVEHTFLRGAHVYDGDGVGEPHGQYLQRPYGAAD